MGQYYKPMILGDLAHVRAKRIEFIRLWLSAFEYGTGLKLTEHSYLKNKLVSAFEYLISPDGVFHMSRVVWAGDYADEEPEYTKNLYNMVEEEGVSETSKLQTPPVHDTTCYRYIVNHTKMMYVDKNASSDRIHPLPLLISEGNGRGGGDFRGNDEHLCGTWARDVISVEREKPVGFTELICNFSE